MKNASVLSVVALSLLALNSIAKADDAPVNYWCSASPVDAPICQSADGKNVVNLYDTRAHNVDQWNGLNELVVCNTGFIKVKGTVLGEKTLNVTTSLSTEGSLTVKLPNDSQTNVKGFFEFNYSLDKPLDQYTQQDANDYAPRAEVFYYGDTADLFFVNEDNSGKDTSEKVVLNCK